MNNTSSRRRQLDELLQLLASEQQQLAYESEVRNVDITAELLCMWFDDQYHPQQRHFEHCFTPAELAALDEFHLFYNERVSRLPESQGTIRSWLASPVWREIMESARRTLERIRG